MTTKPMQAQSTPHPGHHSFVRCPIDVETVRKPLTPLESGSRTVSRTGSWSWLGRGTKYSLGVSALGCEQAHRSPVDSGWPHRLQNRPTEVFRALRLIDPHRCPPTLSFGSQITGLYGTIVRGVESHHRPDTRTMIAAIRSA